MIIVEVESSNRLDGFSNVMCNVKVKNVQDAIVSLFGLNMEGVCLCNLNRNKPENVNKLQ